MLISNYAFIPRTLSRRIRTSVFLTLFCIFFAAHARAEPLSVLTDELDQLREQGFDALYRMNYENARGAFQKMIQQDSKHPAGYVYMAATVWLEHMASYRRIQIQLFPERSMFLLPDPKEPRQAAESEFTAYITKATIRAEMRLRKDDMDPIGLYYLGTAYATIAGFEGTINRSFMTAMRKGNEGADYHRKLLKEHPDFVDAELTVGLYDYVAGALPSVAKFFMLLGGIRGNKERGLDELNRVWEKGSYTPQEAGLMLAVIYNREKEWNKALIILQKLCAQYPENFIFQLHSAALLLKMNRVEETLPIYESLMANEAVYSQIGDFLHYQIAEVLFAMKEWEKAHKEYLAARRAFPVEPDPLVTMTHLRAGQCLNAMGRNDDANVEYQFVLNQRDVKDSKKFARQYIKEPFQP